MNNSIILKCVNLCKSYRDGDSFHHVLNNVCFVLNPGDMTAIVGKSGSGKSTLLHILSGLDVPTSGNIFFYGQSFTEMSSKTIADFRNKKLGFVHQFHHLLLDFTVIENISMPLLIAKMDKKEAIEKSYQMLKTINLEKKTKKYPSELSGGERQKVAIARALINNPSLIIADEPTGHLDQYNKETILNLIFKINHDCKTSFIIVTHDDVLVKKIPILFKMNHGQLVRF